MSPCHQEEKETSNKIGRGEKAGLVRQGAAGEPMDQVDMRGGLQKGSGLLMNALSLAVLPDISMLKPARRIPCWYTKKGQRCLRSSARDRGVRETKRYLSCRFLVY